MARYASGDTEAFDQLFRRYERRAYVFFLRRTSSPQRAEDLYQELFLRIHRARDEFDSGRVFTPWFFQIAHRLLIDDLRRAFRAREIGAIDFDAPAAIPNTEAAVADRQEVEFLLDILSPEERYVVVASKMEGIGYPELADQLGKSVDAVKKMASRALQRIRSEASSADPLEAAAG
ncbi:MAG TPA: sigma-70 family RNA polymerase sigma factor [Myxococcota bacterium]|nr:sigma-70 family RNA polymerase sigma factor [Myxococcota bacterium]